MAGMFTMMATASVSGGTSTTAMLGPFVPKWMPFEIELHSDRSYGNPLWDVSVTVQLAAANGQQQTVDAFWDGGRTWRFRFCPGHTGRWHWRTLCSNAADTGLHDASGAFRCIPYDGNDPLVRQGPIALSPDRRSFVHADGTPFFWLACTAWNGALRSSRTDWARYLHVRRQQRFSVIQFVCTQWRGGDKVLRRSAFSGPKRIHVNPEFFQALDPKVDAVNRAGLVAAPVLLWAFADTDPGRALPEQDAIRLARYMTARWGAHNLVWLLGGDGHYLGDNVRRWRNIGRAVFADRHDRLVTLHPCGRSWVGDDYAHEAWFDFAGYQSGHGDGDEHLAWNVTGPPARCWQKAPALPIVNLEPNYEAHPAYQSGKKHDDHHVRRAAYWSLLVAPPAGVTYGHNAVWVWNERAGPAEGHPNVGEVAPWHTGLDTPGARSMSVLRDLLETGPWMQLRPQPNLLAEQPGELDPRRFVAAALTEDRTWALVYLPAGGQVRIDAAEIRQPADAGWIDPRTGRRVSIGPPGSGWVTYRTPDDHDWVLELRSRAV